MVSLRRTVAALGAVLLLMAVASPAPCQSAGITVVDAVGRTVKFSRPPERIVVAGKAVFMLADALYLFPEAVPRIVAIGRTVQTKLDFIPVIDPGYAHKTILESDAGPEQIAAARPDAVILKSSVAQSLGRSVEALGVPVVYLDFETPEQYGRDLLTLGRLFRDEERAMALIASFRRWTDRTARALEGLAERDKPRVLLVYYNAQGGAVALSVPPLGWIQTTLVRLSGGIPVWKDAQIGSGWTRVSVEQIAAWDADQIYVVGYSTEAGEAVRRLRTDPQWQALRAVKQGKLYAFAGDFYCWDQPDPRWVLGLTWLASKVNPDRFTDLDLPREIRSFYGEFYGMDGGTFARSVQPALGGLLP